MAASLSIGFEYRMDCMVYNLKNLGYNTGA